MSKIQKRALRILIYGSLALVVSALYVIWFARPPEPQSNHSVSNSGLAGVQIHGEFDLVDHKGKNVSEHDYAGQYNLIYFGFTYCPAVCPTELQKIAAAYQKLGDLKDEVTPIFITVDPERDSVEVMAGYVAHFHPDMIGLTGSPAQIEQVKKTFKVYASKVRSEEATDYTVDHSSFIYLMSPGNDLLRIFRPQDTAPEIARQIKTILNERS